MIATVPLPIKTLVFETRACGGHRGTDSGPSLAPRRSPDTAARPRRADRPARRAGGSDWGGESDVRVGVSGVEGAGVSEGFRSELASFGDASSAGVSAAEGTELA